MKSTEKPKLNKFIATPDEIQIVSEDEAMKRHAEHQAELDAFDKQRKNDPKPAKK